MEQAREQGCHAHSEGHQERQQRQQAGHWVDACMGQGGNWQETHQGASTMCRRSSAAMKPSQVVAVSLQASNSAHAPAYMSACAAGVAAPAVRFYYIPVCLHGPVAY
jgi:hypothetical protein